MRYRQVIQFLVITIVLIVVGSFCYNSVSASMRADSLVAIAERSAAESAENAHQVQQLRAELDRQNKKARAQVAAIQKQNRVQRHQIDLLVRLLRKNGLAIPTTAILTPAPAPRYTVPRTTRPAPTPSAPGKSGDKRNPKTLTNPRAR